MASTESLVFPPPVFRAALDELAWLRQQRAQLRDLLAVTIALDRGPSVRGPLCWVLTTTVVVATRLVPVRKGKKACLEDHIYK